MKTVLLLAKRVKLKTGRAITRGQMHIPDNGGHQLCRKYKVEAALREYEEVELNSMQTAFCRDRICGSCLSVERI